jgi:predicted CXXCH cytochrome family protein
MRFLFDRAPVFCAGLILLALGLFTPALAQETAPEKAPAVLSAAQVAKIEARNAECLACHSEAGLAHPPKEGLDLPALRAVLKDPIAFKGSDHQRLACTKCHNEGYEDHPHEPDAREMTSTCTDCHSKKANLIEKEFEQSVHAANLSDTFTCTTCHDPHVMRLAEKLGDPHKIVAQDNRVCLGCHDSDDQFAQFAPEKKTRPLIDDIHDWLPNTRLHWSAVRCVECHTPEVAAGQMISHQILDKDKAEKDCLTCHSANSTLKTRLYRHLVKEEQERLGFANSVILSSSYVLGATRHPVLDTLVLGAFAAMLLGLLAHGLGRFLTRHAKAKAKNSNGHDAEHGDHHG